MKLILVLSLLILASCQPNGGAGGASGQQGGASPVAQGTGSVGGGGNGIDDKMIESFAIRIDTLPEFKRYIEPVIRKISRGRGDVMTAYMNFAVHGKPWYLIPRPLENLSKEQIGTAFPTDQFALHSDERVYIAKAFYDKMNQKERASLLMHEIVMGARLLMKKTPKEQCEKLAGSNVNACSDPEMMKLAEAQDLSDSQRGTMDDHDHDAVKAMTIFLLQRTEDVTAESVAQKRRELGFIFPWDKAESQLTLGSMGAILNWAKLSDTEFIPAPAPKSSKPHDYACNMRVYNQNDEWLSLQFALIEDKVYPDWTSAKQAADPLWPASATQTSFDQSNLSKIYNVLNRVDMGSGLDMFEARGAIDPTNSKRVVDLVRLRPYIAPQSVSFHAQQPDQYPDYQMEFWVTREEHPQIVQISVRRVKVSMIGSPDYENIQPEDWQFVPSRKEEFRCVPKVVNSATAP